LKPAEVISACAKTASKLFGLALRCVLKLLPLKKRVLFYTMRADGMLEENMQCVYDLVRADKTVFAKRLPHSARDRLRTYALLLTNKVIVTDDYLGYLRTVKLRPEQRLVQVWHACGLFKKFALDVPARFAHAYSRQDELDTHSRYDAFIVASEQSRQTFADAVGIGVEHVLALGVPRTDLLLDEQRREALRRFFFGPYSRLSGKKIYAYFPTFREKDGSWTPFDPQIDWDALDAALGDDEAFVIHAHPMTRERYITKEYARIFDLSGCSSQELLAAADVLVTDYSSVMVEAAMLGIPTVFYCPDFDTYERDFYIAYPGDLPGDVVYSGGGLLAAIREAAAQPQLERMEKFCRWQTEACDGKSSARVAALVEGYLNS